MTSPNPIEQVPLLSLEKLSADAFADAIGSSFRASGFAMVTDHGMDPDLVAELERSVGSVLGIDGDTTP